MTPEYDHEYPPAGWTADEIAATLRRTEESYPIPTYHDVSFWRSIRDDGDVRGIVEAARERATVIATEPVVPLSASGYLRYEREGSRSGYPDKRRRRNLSALVLAECLDREGKYIDPIFDYIWAICEQSTWTQPAHLSRDDAEYLAGLPQPVPPEDRRIALRSAGTAKLLAEVRYVLGERLHPAIRKRVRHEIDRRLLTPYLANDDFDWFHPPANNWNAVCNGSVLIAALHAGEDADRQAKIVEKAVGSMRHYLNSFDRDGCTSEGIGYWKYGFGFYTKAAAHLEERTAGKYSLFSPPIVRKIADFPLRVELSPNRFPAFSDTNEKDDITPYIACKLGRRLELRNLAARGRRDLANHTSVGYFSSVLRNLAWSRFDVDEESPPPRRSFFEGRQWWLIRADPDDVDGLVVAAKGGHNGESHNHNDCGSFICHYRRESLLTDPGRGSYEPGYFGDERYGYFAARSLGHSVPYVNGYEQAPGREFGATVLDRTVDDELERYVLDLAGCYPDGAGLESLHREFVFDRTAGADGQLRVSDGARFDPDAPGYELTSVLVSHAPITAENGRLVVSGERSKVTIDFDSDVESEVERIEEHLQEVSVWRARLALSATDTHADLGVTITPEPDE